LVGRLSLVALVSRSAPSGALATDDPFSPLIVDETSPRATTAARFYSTVASTT